MPYTGSPSTDSGDAIRLLIGDISTSTGGEIFADGEIDYFNAQKPNAFFAAALAVESLIGTDRGISLAAVVEKQVGDLRIKYGGEGPNGTLTSKAKALRSEGARKAKPFAGGISRADKSKRNQDTDRTQPAFKLGQFANPSLSTSTFR